MAIVSTRRAARILVAGLLTLGPAAGLPAPLEAQTLPKKERAQAKKQHARAEPDRRNSPLPEPYIERDAKTIRFGTQAWWDQMQRENRLSGESP